MRTALAVGLALWAAQAPALAQENCRQVDFAGGVKVTLSGSLGADDAACYQISTRPGDAVAVLVPNGSNTMFSIDGVVEGKGRFAFKAQLESYRIRVTPITSRPEDYRLEINVIGAPARPSASAVPTISQSRREVSQPVLAQRYYCTPFEPGALILKSPHVADLHPEWVPPNSIGTGWGLTDIRRERGFYSGRLVSPRGAPQPYRVYVVPSQWSCH